MKKILSVNDLYYSYHTDKGEIPAIDGISFDIYDGEFVSIVGASGCGKTTLLSLLANLNKPESGNIAYYSNGTESSDNQIGYMLQKDELLPWRSIYKNLLLPLEINHCITSENEAYLLSLLKKYDLLKFKDAAPSELSGGMRQRAALIRTLVRRPNILLLDEPFSALDYQTRLNVSDDIGKIIKDEKKTAILVTHDLSEAISLSDRVIVLTKRPAKIKNIIEIKLSNDPLVPLSARNAKEFPYYFNLLWKEMNE